MGRDQVPVGLLGSMTFALGTTGSQEASEGSVLPLEDFSHSVVTIQEGLGDCGEATLSDQ